MTKINLVPKRRYIYFRYQTFNYQSVPFDYNLLLKINTER